MILYNNKVAGNTGHINDHNEIASRLKSVMEYGAYADGTHDDTSYIQQAINSGSVNLEHRTFKINTTLFITTSNVKIYGDMQGATIHYSGSQNAFEITGTAGSEVLYTEFRNLKIIGEVGSQSGIVGSLFGRLYFDNMKISNFDLYGISLSNGWSPSFNRVYVEDIGVNGIQLSSGSNHRMNIPFLSDCVISRADNIALNYVDTRNSSGVRLVNSTFQESGSGVLLDGGASHLIDGCHFEWNRSYDLRLGSTNIAKNTMINANYFLDWETPICIGIDLLKHENTSINYSYITGKTIGININTANGSKNIDINLPTIVSSGSEVVLNSGSMLGNGKRIKIDTNVV
jgi:uncharacterized protein YjbI with pentapeptide repeats